MLNRNFYPNLCVAVLAHQTCISSCLLVYLLLSLLPNFLSHKLLCFFAKASEHQKGTQIDLIIDRQDNTVNLCEIKFYNDEFTLTKAYAENLREKRRIFKRLSKTRKQVFITLITNNTLQELCWTRNKWIFDFSLRCSFIRRGIFCFIKFQSED